MLIGKCLKKCSAIQTSNWNNVNNCLKFPIFNFNTLENHPSPFSSTRFGDAEMKFYNGKVHHVNDSSFYEVSRESPVLFQISISVRFRTIRDRADGKESF
ncbi:hypothetical protein M5689_000147 [Euphorbia peplus]|nr:hypothetical protein M5689_000147 [Euphorbia peplus]